MTRSESTSGDEYILGTNAMELERLGFQHRLWSEAAHALWERGRIGPGQSVLDFGCGPGFASMDLAQLVGSSGRVVGVDLSPGFVAQFNREAAARGLSQASALVADASGLDATGLQPGSFDVVYARWVFCFVPDPARAVHSLASLLRPGGVLLVQDYFNYTAMTTSPRRESFTRVVGATAEAWRRRGGDPDVMGRLPSMAHEAGLSIEHVGVHQRLALPGSMMWNWPRTFWRNFLPVLEQMGLVTRADGEAFMRDLEDLARTEYGFVVLPAVYDLVARRP